MIFIHITWDRSQRSHSCLHSIEVDRACKHAHIHKNTHANEGTMPKLLTCAVPTGTMAACQRSLARGPTLEKIGTCASLRTVPDPVSASQQRSKLLLLTMRSAGRSVRRSIMAIVRRWRREHKATGRGRHCQNLPRGGNKPGNSRCAFYNEAPIPDSSWVSVETQS